MAAEILFVGDMHLGRRPRRLPHDLEEYGVGPSELTPAAAFRQVVDHALAAPVAAVVFAGDVVDSENSRFEAYGQLRQGVTRLTERGIGVFAVAGNHDVEALPRLAASINGFRLLGSGGRWEQVVVREGSRPVARLLGWSFTDAVHETSPLAQPEFPAGKVDDLPLLGVLHCDLAVSESPYAPVRAEELRRSPADGWLLGHIHKPSPLTGPRPIGYLGSLVGLNPGETGARGVWVVRLPRAGGVEIRPEPLAPLRWESIEASIEGSGDAESIERAIRTAIEELAAEVATGAGPLRAVGCRIRLTGMTRRLDVGRVVEKCEFTRLRFKLGSILYFVDRVEDATTPEIDLDSLASRHDPPGILAARLSMLERDDDSEQTRLLLQCARRELQRAADDRRWLNLEAVELGDAAVRRLLIDSGKRMLAALLEQSRDETR